MKRNEKDLAKFNALPKSTQEKLLGKFLAGNAEARKAFEKNEVCCHLSFSLKDIYAAMISEMPPRHHLVNLELLKIT